MKYTWYESSTGNHQGLVIEEQTGRNVAVSYDKEDARLIAAAPDLFVAAKDAAEYLRWNKGIASPIYDKLVAAINKAEGK